MQYRITTAGSEMQWKQEAVLHEEAIVYKGLNGAEALVQDWRNTPHGGFWLTFSRDGKTVCDFELCTIEEAQLIFKQIRF